MKRVVLYGPPIAGKTTIIRELARIHGARVEPIRDEGLRLAGGSACVRTAAFEAATITSPYMSDDAQWPPLIARATQLALVIDGQLEREEATREFVERLGSLPRVPSVGCVVWTKGDLRAKGRPWISRAILDGTPFERWRAFETRIDAPATLVEPVSWLVSSAPSRSPLA